MNQNHRNASPPRGSALLMVTVLLGVLAVVGVAAVSLGSQERVNAAAKGKRDMMAACADAARLLIWAETARNASARLRTPLEEMRVTLADGTVLGAPAHYGGGTGLQVVDLAAFQTPTTFEGSGAVDCTNAYCPEVSENKRNSYAFVARCRDHAGRETEVEFNTMLMF